LYFESDSLIQQPPFHDSIQSVAGVWVLEKISENVLTNSFLLFGLIELHCLPASIYAFAVHSKISQKLFNQLLTSGLSAKVIGVASTSALNFISLLLRQT